jgi:hypothetical protein
VPGHSGLKIFVQVGLVKNSRSVNILQPVVIELLTIPKASFLLFHQSMIWHVPSAVTYVETSHEAYFLVDDDHFLVVTPELRYCDVRMSVDFDVFVNAFEMFLDVLGVVVDQ